MTSGCCVCSDTAHARACRPSRMQSSTETDDWVPVGHGSSLAGSTGRLQACIKGRYVTVLRVRGELTCIDSICFHAGGPLGLGDIEDVNGQPCLICPWHKYKIDALTGEKYYQAASWQDGKMVPGEWKSNGPRHRIHNVQERQDGLIYVQLDTSSNALSSDQYAFDKKCGDRVMSAPNTAAGRAAASAGADGSRLGPWLKHQIL